MRKGKLFIFSAPSGAGKTTIVKHLVRQDFNLHFSVSATTRTKRKNEKEGLDYYFLKKEDFFKKVEKNEFIEWEEVYEGKFYGTLRKVVDTMLENGQNIIFDIDVLGGLNIKKVYDEEALAVFIMPPSIKVLEKRIKKRATDDSRDQQERITKAKWELCQADKFDKILINDILELALKEAEDMVANFLKNKN